MGAKIFRWVVFYGFFLIEVVFLPQVSWCDYSSRLRVGDFLPHLRSRELITLHYRYEKSSSIHVSRPRLDGDLSFSLLYCWSFAVGFFVLPSGKRSRPIVLCSDVWVLCFPCVRLDYGFPPCDFSLRRGNLPTFLSTMLEAHHLTSIRGL